MRRLLVEVTCDKCETVTPEEEAVNIELVLSNIPSQTLEIDLCKDCVDGFVHGARSKPRQKKEKKKKKESAAPATPASPQADGAEEYKCTVCSKTFKTPRGLKAHQTRAEH